jgi:hypothetical protein
MDGNTVGAAAVAAGMCERTARHWQEGPFPSATKTARTWQTREDPFEGIWTTEVVPRLAADKGRRLQALTLFDWLCERHPGRFQPGQVRTLQRRVRDWRAQHGSDVEAYFEQTAVPGREGALDFTDASGLGVTIQGNPFPHLLFEWVLSFSGWTYVALAASETFEALVAGLQGAVWTLGAAPAGVSSPSASGVSSIITVYAPRAFSPVRRTKTAWSSKRISARRPRWSRRCYCAAMRNSSTKRPTRASCGK